MTTLERARRSTRTLRVLAHIGAGFVLALGTGAFFAPHRPLVRRASRWWLAELTRILRLNVTVIGELPSRPALFVANHVSWVDIPVLGGIAGVHFLSKTEVAEWPLIGRLATAAGTLYIRRGQGQVRQRARQIAAQIGLGNPVLVFPEGTTTDGRDVRAFHSPLFAAASDGGHPVQPVAIRYLDANGEPHPRVPFIGDDEFTAHLWRLLGGDAVQVEVHFLPLLAGDSPQELATAAQSAVRRAVTAPSLATEPVPEGVAG